MAITKSFQLYKAVPSAVISEGAITIPLWSVTQMTLTETYQLPPIGSSTMRAIVATHDDTISLTGMLVGAERYTWKFALESLADAGKRGSLVSAIPGQKVSGLILVTSMTIRTDMQIQTLAFTATAAQRDAIGVSVTMAHMPLPGGLGKLLDLASVGVAALADWGGN